MKIIGGILFVIGAFLLTAYLFAARGDGNSLLWAVLLMAGGVLVGYLGSRAVKGEN